MARTSMLLGIVMLGLAFVVSTGSSQDKDKDKKDDPKVKAQLPPGWKDLKLSKDQVQKVYAVIGKYKKKISDLEDQIKALKVEERTEMVKVLTVEQRDLLRKLTVGEDEKDKKDGKEKKE